MSSAGHEPGTRSITTGRLRRDTYHQVKVRLRELVADLAGRGELRLPGEDQLSALLEVSRPTVRSALLSLQKEGKIQRVHGRGTFINRHALRLRANIAEDWPFVELLDALGYEGAVRNLDIHVESLPDDMLAALELAVQEPAVVIERIFEASGEPAVFSMDYVPLAHLDTPVENVEGEDSIFAFVRRYIGRRVRYSIADIVPTVADDAIGAKLCVPVGQPLILLFHTHVDEDDQPVATTRAYINDRFLRFSVVRSYTDS